MPLFNDSLQELNLGACNRLTSTKMFVLSLGSFAGANEEETMFLHKIIPCIYRDSLFPVRLAQPRCHDIREVLIFIPKCHVVYVFGGTILWMKAAHGHGEPCAESAKKGMRDGEERGSFGLSS